MEKLNQIEVVVANPFKGTSKNASKFFGGIDPAFIGNADTIAANPEQKNMFEENLALVKKYRSTLLTKEKEGVVEAYSEHIENVYEEHLAKNNTVLKVGDKVHSDFFGYGKIYTKQKSKFCFKVKFEDGRFNEFTKEGDYIINRSTFKAVEFNNKRKIKKV